MMTLNFLIGIGWVVAGIAIALILLALICCPLCFLWYKNKTKKGMNYRQLIKCSNVYRDTIKGYILLKYILFVFLQFHKKYRKD